MRFVSTRGQSPAVGFLEAVAEGLAPDGGLYVPDHVPVLERDFSDGLPGMSLSGIARRVLAPYVDGEIPCDMLERITEEAFSFDAPLRQIGENLFTLELFHGPTLAFKDFGVRFMARLMEYTDYPPATVLTATSGDTGAAVASAFYGLEKFRVVVLYPRGKISPFQEQQISSLGGNVSALAVEGSFDDCQRLVKQAFGDRDLRSKVRLVSANSINLARLLPQIAYYFRAIAQTGTGSGVVFSVPSGNFGNLAAGLVAKRMGLPASGFIAATNINDVVPRYLECGLYEPRRAQETISNAMDIADPSNFTRILHLYGGQRKALCRDLQGAAFTDEETKEAIRSLHKETGYTADPHGAVALLGLKRRCTPGQSGIFLETAHPVKFRECMEDILGLSYEIPEEFEALMAKPSLAVNMDASYRKLAEAVSRI